MNKYIASGHIGKDAEQKTIAGNCYASFSLAITERVKGEDKTTWIRVMKLDQEGKLTPHLAKGKKVIIVGKPTFSAYIGKNSGEAIPDITVWANEVELCSSGEPKQQPTSKSVPQTRIDNFPPQTDDDIPF